jgi:hypothetical protein
VLDAECADEQVRDLVHGGSVRTQGSVVTGRLGCQVCSNHANHREPSQTGFEARRVGFVAGALQDLGG